MAKIIAIESYVSQKGNPFDVVWVSTASGLPVKVREFRRDRVGTYAKDEEVTLEITPDMNAFASVRIK